MNERWQSYIQVNKNEENDTMTKKKLLHVLNDRDTSSIYTQTKTNGFFRIFFFVPNNRSNMNQQLLKIKTKVN